MYKLRIDMDNYKDFLHSEHGLELMTQIIEKDDYNTIKAIAVWKACSSKLLDKIATKYMEGFELEGPNIKNDLKMLEEVAENPKVSVKTLEKIMEFALSLVDGYSDASEVLEEVAESKKLTADMASRLYKVAVDKNLDDVVEELGGNKNTPDEILFNIIDTFGVDTDMYQAASEEIIRRYRKIKEESSEE